MPEYIDKSKVLELIESGAMWSWSYNVLKEEIQNLPVADVAPVSHGCEYCLDDDCPPLDWEYGLDHILPDYKFCPMCGRLMEDAKNAPTVAITLIR